MPNKLTAYRVNFKQNVKSERRRERERKTGGQAGQNGWVVSNIPTKFCMQRRVSCLSVCVSACEWVSIRWQNGRLFIFLAGVLLLNLAMALVTTLMCRLEINRILLSKSTAISVEQEVPAPCLVGMAMQNSRHMPIHTHRRPRGAQDGCTYPHTHKDTPQQADWLTDR